MVLEDIKNKSSTEGCQSLSKVPAKMDRKGKQSSGAEPWNMPLLKRIEMALAKKQKDEEESEPVTDVKDDTKPDNATEDQGGVSVSAQSKMDDVETKDSVICSQDPAIVKSDAAECESLKGSLNTEPVSEDKSGSTSCVEAVNTASLISCCNQDSQTNVSADKAESEKTSTAEVEFTHIKAKHEHQSEDLQPCSAQLTKQDVLEYSDISQDTSPSPSSPTSFNWCWSIPKSNVLGFAVLVR